METIVDIEETTFKRTKDDWNSFDGFIVSTDKQVIKLGISNGQSCCENWGYFMTEDSLKEFEGAKLVGITLTDKALKTERLNEEYAEVDDCMFVNLETDKGLLQFVAYNSHNGYYGHEAVVVSEALNVEECL